MSTITEQVKSRYGAIAQTISSNSSCRTTTCCKSPQQHHLDPITRDLYTTTQASSLPSTALKASLGCGNPTAMVDIQVGHTVLDLGSGGGIDCLLSARKVGSTGKIYGLDMTESMIELAKRNALEAGFTNVEFLQGSIEKIPLPDETVDVIISNCVINLSTDKDTVLKEAYRVLKLGGKFAVSDIVLRNELPTDIQRNMEMWTGCVAGALLKQEYIEKLLAAGFKEATVEEVRVYDESDVEELAKGKESACCSSSRGGFAKDDIKAMAGNVMSAFIRATK